MLFASLPFILVFLPVAVLGAFLCRRNGGAKAAIIFLVAASLVFYGWHQPAHILLLLTSILANFALGQRLWLRRDKLLLTVGVTFNLGLLAWFKYAGFLVENVEAVFGLSAEVGRIVLPLGISFFTFQQIAYLVDVHQRKAEPHGLLDYVFFVVFFPQLIAGPIVHHGALIPQLANPAFARFLASDVLAGVLLFSLGLAKKALVADQLRFGADRLFEAVELGIEPSLTEAWFSMLCYSFQIYFDFSGYSDMAVGLGRIFGLRLPVNFDSPYKAASIVDFWRRWNITLSHFLRDYLYIPIGGNRRSPLLRYVNLWIVMLLGGLWHGAGWSFVVWGGLHGLYLASNHAWGRFGFITLPRPVATAITFFAVVIAWVFFRADSFDHAFVILRAMLGGGTIAAFDLALLEGIHEGVLPLGIVLVLAGLLSWTLPNSNEIVARIEAGGGVLLGANRLALACGSLTALALFHVYTSGSYEFIYFQF
jgi:D-alanyl-lipoteichoic acid acyltransferase DltB (MBOAT superfamily)